MVGCSPDGSEVFHAYFGTEVSWVQSVRSPKCPVFMIQRRCLCACLGFSSAKTVTVSNTSDVQLHYHALVPNDGSRPPVCFDRLVSSDDRSEYDEPDVEMISEEQPTGSETAVTKPKEFTVQPSSGVLEPHSDLTFTVTLCPNSMAQYFRELAVNFDEVANKTYTIPITAQYVDWI